MSTSDTARPVRRGVASRAVVAACLGLAVTLGGCANYETQKPYQPAAGVQTDAAGVMVRNLMFIMDGQTGHLNGSLIAAKDDQLTAIAGHALKTDDSQGEALTLKTETVEMPADRRIDLAEQQITTSGLTAGGLARITLTFANASEVTMVVPVLDPIAAGLGTPSSTPS